MGFLHLPATVSWRKMPGVYVQKHGEDRLITVDLELSVGLIC